MGKLPTNWRLVRLDELGTVERGRSRHRPRNDPSLYGGKYPFVQTGDVKAAGLKLSQYSQTYSDVGLAQSRLWPPDTLCITIAANICDTSILAIPACFPDSIVGFTPTPQVADVVFVKYALDHAKQRFSGISRGATQDNLSLEKLLSQRLPVPPIEDQRRIASILGAYDELIEVNRRRIALLEETAQRHFDEWFVRFRFPGHEGHAIVETKDGSLPEGWECRTLKEVCARPNGIQTGPFGSQLHQSDYEDDGVPVVMPKNIIGLRVVEHGIARISEQKANDLGRHRMLLGDVVYGRRGEIGRRAYITLRENGWFCGTGCLRLRPDTQIISSRFFFDALGLTATLGAIRARAQGATMPNLSAGAMADVPVMVPPPLLQERYSQIAEPMAELVANLQTANVSLGASRDLLLPRLISGELSVSVVQRELEAVA
jgi:type I restriction enzyme S subunit